MRWWSLFGKRSVRERKRAARRRRACRTLQLETMEPRQLLSTVSILGNKSTASEQPQTNGLPDAGQVCFSLDAAASEDLTVTFQLGGTATYDYYSPSSGDGFVRIEQTRMGNVVDKAYVISAEAMPLLQQFFQQSGGKGVP